MANQVGSATPQVHTTHSQMTWPAVNGDQWLRPLHLSPIAYH